MTPAERGCYILDAIEAAVTRLCATTEGDWYRCSLTPSNYADMIISFGEPLLPQPNGITIAFAYGDVVITPDGVEQEGVTVIPDPD